MFAGAGFFSADGTTSAVPLEAARAFLRSVKDWTGDSINCGMQLNDTERLPRGFLTGAENTSSSGGSPTWNSGVLYREESVSKLACLFGSVWLLGAYKTSSAANSSSVSSLDEEDVSMGFEV